MKMELSTFNYLKNIHSEEVTILNDKQLKQIQQISLEILDDVVAVCTQYNLRYFLGGGSALGALRHKGFIPWDDDIDINMPRADYERFVQVFTQKYSAKYALQTPQNTANYALSFAKVRKRETVMRGRDDLCLDECGVGLDIFIIENTFNNPFLRIGHGVMALALGFLLSARKFYRDRRYWIRFMRHLEHFNSAICLKIGIGFLISFVSVDWLCRLTDRWHGICKDDESKWVCGCAGRLHYFGELYLRDEFCVTRTELFEGRILNVPIE